MEKNDQMKERLEQLLNCPAARAAGGKICTNCVTRVEDVLAQIDDERVQLLKDVYHKGCGYWANSDGTLTTFFVSDKITEFAKQRRS